MKIQMLVVAVLTLTSCTVVRYESADRTLTVIDIHPSGESLSLQGAIDGIGTLDVNREHPDSASVIGSTVDAMVGI